VPQATEVFCDFQRGICVFKALPIFHKQESIDAHYCRTVLFHKLLPGRALHRCEYESTERVSLNDEVDGTIAENAHAIKNYNMAVVHLFPNFATAR
jgi:hypothetical protein